MDDPLPYDWPRVCYLSRTPHIGRWLSLSINEERRGVPSGALHVAVTIGTSSCLACQLIGRSVFLQLVY